MDEATQFREWATSHGVPAMVVERLLCFLPDDADLDPELPDWITSATNIMQMNDPDHGLAFLKSPLDEGFLVIGSCPDGDPVAVNFRDPKMPVFYVAHGNMYNTALAKVIRQVSDSIDNYFDAMQRGEFPMD